MGGCLGRERQREERESIRERGERGRRGGEGARKTDTQRASRRAAAGGGGRRRAAGERRENRGGHERERAPAQQKNKATRTKRSSKNSQAPALRKPPPHRAQHTQRFASAHLNKEQGVLLVSSRMRGVSYMSQRNSFFRRARCSVVLCGGGARRRERCVGSVVCFEEAESL